MSNPSSPSRRHLIQSSLAIAAGAALPVNAFADPTWQKPAPPLTAPPPRGLAAVTSVVSGVGVYVGNDWYEWDDAARRWAMARVRGWGFDFICPKVGGYGRTWYKDEGQLRSWAESAKGIGLGFVPFIYTIPDTHEDDAKLAAQLANVVGIVSVDMEDEWGSKEKDAVPGYKGTEMANFGRIYRELAGPKPVIVTGYGDPITRFGPAETAYPNAEMAAWMDLYSPQWYIGVYSRYKSGGVKAALDWGKAECRQALGNFPITPSIDLECSYTPDHLFPLNDTLALMADMRTYNAPIFVWEYGLMTPQHAEALLGPPQVNNLRVGRVRQTSFDIAWDSRVPARSVFAYAAPPVPGKPTAGTVLNLTHSEGAAKLAPETAYQVTVQSQSGGGQSPVVPLTVATWPKTPGVYVQSILATRTAAGHATFAVSVANSAATDAAEVKIIAITVNDQPPLAPSALPLALGTIALRDRTTFSVIAPVASAGTLTLHVTGTAAGGVNWTSTLPVTVG